MTEVLALSRLNRTRALVNCIVPFLFKLLGLALIKSIHHLAHLHLQMPSANSMFNFYIPIYDKKPMNPALETNHSRHAAGAVSTAGEAQA
jgi:hypothetical protein